MRSVLERWRSEGAGGVLARGAAASLVFRAAGLLAGFGSQVLLARVLGKVSYGHYFYVVQWLQVLGLVASFGFENAGPRFVAEHAAREEWGLLRGFRRTAMTLPLVASCAIGGLLAGASWLLRERMDSELFHAFLLGGVVMPAATLLTVIPAQLRGLKRVALSESMHQVLRPSLLAVGTLVVLASGVGLQAPLAVAVHGLSSLVALLVAWFALERAMPAPARTTEPSTRLRTWLGVAVSLSLVAGFGMLLRRTDGILVGFFVNTTESGIYANAVRVAELPRIGLIAIQVISGPVIAELQARRERSELQRSLGLAAAGGVGLAAVGGVLVVLAGRPLLSAFGEDFVVGYPVVVIMTVTTVIQALAGPAPVFAGMAGHHRLAAWTMGAAAAVNLGLNCVLIPLFGMEGAAVATGLSTLGATGFLAWHARRARGFDTTPLGLLRPPGPDPLGPP